MLNGEKNVTRVQKEDKDFIRSLMTVPATRRNMFMTLASAYMDGMAAGEAIAAAEVSKSKALG